MVAPQFSLKTAKILKVFFYNFAEKSVRTIIASYIYLIGDVHLYKNFLDIFCIRTHHHIKSVLVLLKIGQN